MSDSRVPSGVPLDSGFDYEAVDQEAEREVTRRIQREIAARRLAQEVLPFAFSQTGDEK